MEQILDARSFPTHYAALGFLAEQPMHGYELRRRLTEGLGALWRIASSQLYSVLHRLEDQGWVEAHVESNHTRPPKIVYSMTSDGRRALEDWLSQPVAHLREVRVELLAKLYFLRRHAPDAVADLIDAQIRSLEETEAGLAARERLNSDDEELGEIAVSFRRKRMRGTIEWLRENKQRLADRKENL